MTFSSLRPALTVLLALFGAVALPAQKRDKLESSADFFKEPNGTLLGKLAAGSSVAIGVVRGNWQEITIEGWIASNALRDDKREGFDVSVNLADGTTIRSAPGASAGVAVGTARAGALFNRLETKSGWVHVRRTIWVTRAALAQAEAKPTPAAPPPAAQASSQAPSSAASMSMLGGGTAISAVPLGPAMGKFETPVKAEVLERRGGWTHVRIDGWVPDGALGDAPLPGSITASDLRSQPDRYVGQTVEWTLQVIAVQKADELRPELPEGQPYVLARGPLPESGFVYMVISSGDEESFRSLQPLTKVRVRATIRAGRSKYLPVPVLTFVRRLDS